MSENPYETPQSTLFDEKKDQVPIKPPGLWEQIVGVFSEPTVLFKKLGQTPSWAWALGATIVVALFMVIVWGLKVDADSFFRPLLEKDPRVTAENIDGIIDFQKKFLIPGGIIQTLFMMPIIALFMALLYWLVGMGTAEGEKPNYVRALSLATVPNLIMIPQMILMSLMCFLKAPVSVSPEKLSPTSLGFFVHLENPKLQALLHSLDLFDIGFFAIFFLGARYITRLKPLGATLCTCLVVLLSVGFRVLFAR